MGFFKSYDMRGTYGVDFDLSMIRSIGYNLPQVLNAKRILVGRDARSTSSEVRDALVEGLMSAGADVTDIGLATTPMTYFYTAQGEFDASVQITASHNPPSDNGLKVSSKGALPVGYDTGLSEIEKRIKVNPFVKNDGAGSVTIEKNASEGFVNWLLAHTDGFGDLKFAVDASDGVSGIFVRKLFGDKAIYLNDVPDGSFPHHSPNPLLPEAREQIAELVRREGLDCGLIFDGDADRVMVVDERGEFIQPDYLIPICAASCIERLPEPQKTGNVVINDVRTSRSVQEAIVEMGQTPIMGKVGHAFAKVLLRKTNAVCGGELAGHYYIREFFNCDSGELAAIRLLEAFAKAKKEGRSVSALLEPLTTKYANSGEMNFRVEDKDGAIARVLKVAANLGKERERTDMDGVRIDFEEGWISIRKSNTAPYLRLIVECDSKERLEKWVALLKNAIISE
jgi:phosphomannomutase